MLQIPEIALDRPVIGPNNIRSPWFIPCTEGKMCFRTGRQVQIGNGSTVSLLGFQDDEELRRWLGLKQAHLVHCLVNIICEQVPSSEAREQIALMHAQAVLIEVASTGRPGAGGTVVSSPNEGELRVLIRTPEFGEIRDVRKLLLSFARKLSRGWDAVRFAEFGESERNRALTPELDRKCPIRPYQVNINKQPSSQQGRASGRVTNDVSLGFYSEAAEKVAGGILGCCRLGGTWAVFHDHGLPPGESIVGALREKWEMTDREYDEGLRYLIGKGYLEESTGRFPHFVREKFVVHCWRKGIELPLSSIVLH